MEEEKTTTTRKTNATPKFTVRTMRLHDVDKCLQIWARVELTEARSTVASSLALEPEAFNVAELDESNEVIGMCAAPQCCNGGSAFIGFYAVEPEYQNFGIGRELWAKTVGQLDDNLNKGLYGVPEMVQKYKKAGFIKEDSISMLVYTTDPVCGKNGLDLSQLCRFDQLQQTNEFQGITMQVFAGNLNDGEEDDEGGSPLFENLISFDAQIQGFSRKDLLNQYLTGDDVPLTIILSGPNNSVQGYGIIRRDNNQGGIIGPIYANNLEICEVILRELITKFELPEGKIFTIMPLTSNHSAIDLLQKVGFAETDECSRLFTRFVPKADLPKIFYIHSPNFSLF